MDGEYSGHDINECYRVTEWTLRSVFRELYDARVDLEGIVLKPNMVIAGQKCAKQASPAEVAEKTIKCLKATVPSSVPGIAFLSGGQSDEAATEHLSIMNAAGPLPWPLTFSYGRALQAAALAAWGGKPENVAAGQRAFTHRAKMNGLAALGKWSRTLEKAA
jgi:fructose-bisphosphate aldolase, class I